MENLTARIEQKMSNPKKPYEPPIVTKRGNLKFLTQNTNASNGIDSGPQVIAQGDLTGDKTPEKGIDEDGDKIIDYIEIGGTGKTVNVQTSLSFGNLGYYDSDQKDLPSSPNTIPVTFDFAAKDGILYHDAIPEEEKDNWVDEGPSSGGSDPWDIADGEKQR